MHNQLPAWSSLKMKVTKTLAMVLLFHLQLSVDASPCDVTAISARPDRRQLRVHFDLSLRDEASCPGNRTFEIHAVYSGDGFNSVRYVRASKASLIALEKRGKFRLQWISGHKITKIKSGDFWMPGARIDAAYQVSGFRSDRIHFHLAEDEHDRVEHLLLLVYKFLENKKVLVENVTGNATDVLKENLSPDDCYFFELKPIGRRFEIRFEVYPYTDYMRCAIIRQGFPGRPLCLTQPLPDATRVTVGVVVPALVLLVAAASFCVVRKMSARNAAVLAEAEEARMLSSRTKKTELLVIHAREPLHPLHHVHTLRLMDQLRGFCNARVHDIWDHRDPYRLQDPNGWLQRVLSCGSDVKVLLVVSPRVVSVMEAIIERRSQQDLVDLERKGSKEMGFLQMVASIRQLLDIDLFDNYDRVYVVRFSNLWHKEEDILNVITGSRRFCLPEHTENLFVEIAYESS